MLIEMKVSHQGNDNEKMVFFYLIINNFPIPNFSSFYTLLILVFSHSFPMYIMYVS